MGRTRIISLDEYLDKIYVIRDQERYEMNMAREIQLSNRVLCIAGERGAGKTSAILWVRRYLAKTNPSIRFELLDIRKSYDDLDLSFLETRSMSNELLELQVERSFKLLVRNLLLQQLFPSPDDYKSLVAWALAGPPDDSQLFDSVITADLQDLYGEALGYVNWNAKTNRKERQESVLNLFQTNLQSFKMLRKKLR